MSKHLNGFSVLSSFEDKFTNKHYTVKDVYESDDSERLSFLQENRYIDKTPLVIDNPEGESDIKHVGGGYYELPNGEKVKGKGAAFEALKELERVGE